MAKSKDGSGPVDGPITRRLKATRGDKGWNPPRDTGKADKPDRGGDGWSVTGRKGK